MKPLVTLIAVAAFLPAACSDETAPPAGQPGTAETAATGTPAKPAQVDDSASRMADGKEDSDAIPNRFIGVWDYIKGTCDPASDMRLEIGQAEFGFYESHGRVTGIRNEGEATIVDLDMSGEGETWTQSLRLVLKEDGTRLHVTEPQKESDEDDYPRRRCPA